MIDFGHMKSGYKGHDPMREKAEKLMKTDLKASKKDDFSPAPYGAPENTKMRPYKKGGHVDGAKHGQRIATDNHRPGLAKGKKVSRPLLSTLSRKTGGAVQGKKGPALACGGAMQAEKGPAKLKAGGHAHGGYSRMATRQEKPMMPRKESTRHESKELPRRETREPKAEKPSMPRHMSHRAMPNQEHRKHIERRGKYAEGGTAKQGAKGPAMKKGGEKVPEYGWGGSGKFVTGLKNVPILGQIANLIGLKQGGKVK